MTTSNQARKSAAPLIVATIIAATSTTAIFGWLFKSSYLKAIVPGLTPMNPMTAVSFLCLAITFWLLHKDPVRSRTMAMGLASTVLIIAGSRLVASAFGIDKSLDTLLFSSQLDLELQPNRMAIPTAWCFVATAVSTLCLAFHKPKLLAAQLVSLVPSITGVAVVNCYVFAVLGAQTPGSSVPMAFHTAALFSVVAIAICPLARLQGGESSLMQETNSAKMGRKLIVGLVFIPPILAVATIVCSQLGLYRADYREAILVTTITAIFVLLVWIGAKESSRNELVATAAQENADRANASKSEFLSRMSHELRTPLNAVIGYAQLLEMQSAEPKTLSAANSILKSGKHLLGLINEILDLASIEAGKLTLSIEPVSMQEAIAQAIELVRPMAAARKIEIIQDEESWQRLHAQADRQRLVQVLVNLLTNAVKYNRESGRIYVRCLNHGDGTVSIQIEDSGYGISEEGVKLLFNPFVRVGDTTIEGTGLGLALSDKLAELMGANLHLVSTSHDGSLFGLTLKLVAPPLAIFGLEDLRNPDLPSVEGMGVRIIYIEDNASNIELLEHVFAEIDGVEIIPTVTGQAGIDLVTAQLPDIVFLDLNLPDIHGLQVLERLRANPATASIPVIVLSADATKKQIERLLQAGARAFLTKPLDLPTLFDEVNKVRIDLRKAA